MARPCILLTNDDGIEAAGLHALIRALHTQGFPLMVLAPAHEQSASGMRLTLHQDLAVTRRDDLLDGLELDPGGPPVELVSTYLGRIESLNPQLNAFLTVCGDEALAAAKIAEEQVMRGEALGALHGIPGSHLSIGRSGDQHFSIGEGQVGHSILMGEKLPQASEMESL